MISKIVNIWNKHGFEIILGLCIAFIILAGLYYKFTGKKGNYSKKVYIPTNFSKVKKNNSYGYTPPSRSKDSKGEIECRKVLEFLFRKPFNKARPDFLRNPVTGGNFNLEIDCFNKELRLGVEYNGAQHYKYIPYFHRNKEHFMNQKYRDDMKRRMCKDNGICLIEVPYTVKIEEIHGFLQRELRRRGYKV